MAKHVKQNNAVRWIPVDECGIVWPAAQRDVEESNVKRIMDPFDPDALGVIQVAEKNGKGLYHVIDGQHRIEALKRMGYGDQLIKAEIHSIHDAATAAELFDRLNTSRKPSSLAQFKVRVTAGRESETAINKIVKDAGFYIGQSDSWRAIAAIGTVQEIFRKFGGETLTHTLQTISATWRDDADATNSVVLRGFGYVIGTYGESLDFRRLREKIGKKYTAGNLIAAAKGHAKITDTPVTLGAMVVIVSEYNRGIKSAGRLDMPEQ